MDAGHGGEGGERRTPPPRRTPRQRVFIRVDYPTRGKPDESYACVSGLGHVKALPGPLPHLGRDELPAQLCQPRLEQAQVAHSWPCCAASGPSRPRWPLSFRVIVLIVELGRILAGRSGGERSVNLTWDTFLGKVM
uniref:Putative developmentally-regulated gtp-binding protein 1 n=1 Tax=Ixodes ricinus TaxID=34613 RepID=A0A0K8RI24_IXORI